MNHQLEARARLLGSSSVERGIFRVPALDPEFRELLQEASSPNEVTEIASIWLAAWDRAIAVYESPSCLIYTDQGGAIYREIEVSHPLIPLPIPLPTITLIKQQFGMFRCICRPAQAEHVKVGEIGVSLRQGFTAAPRFQVQDLSPEGTLPLRYQIWDGYFQDWVKCLDGKIWWHTVYGIAVDLVTQTLHAH
jgi:hypothetical protein